MTVLLRQAFTAAAALPASEQDELAARLLAELAAEDEFDRAIAGSGSKLVRLANEALAEHRAGEASRSARTGREPPHHPPIPGPVGRTAGGGSEGNPSRG